ncbi:EAL domain-containing protein [Burkholderia gladioli]|uniref:EAL domain-containing protein n=1 Tax=Burkholderia gladioli TaxID=28095 RepID=UPI003F794D84
MLQTAKSCAWSRGDLAGNGPIATAWRSGGEQAVRGFVESRLSFRTEPVSTMVGQRAPLYAECLARLNDGGRSWLPNSFLPQLEMLGLMRWFDALVFERVVGRLREDATLVLGCNLSASSTVFDAQWEGVFSWLSSMPGVASRLVVEITESAPLDAVQGRNFVRRVRHLGCRIAVDDFGVGYGVATGMAIGNPDIVKLDASVVAAARDDVIGRRNLHALSGIAAELAPEVVIEGIETEQDLHLAGQTSAQWFQGRYAGTMRPDATS